MFKAVTFEAVIYRKNYLIYLTLAVVLVTKTKNSTLKNDGKCP